MESVPGKNLAEAALDKANGDVQIDYVPVLEFPSLTPEAVLGALSTVGAFSLNSLPADVATLNASVFALFQRFEVLPTEKKERFAIQGNSVEKDGWHQAGGLSTYNKNRAGYIFQASTPFPDMLEDPRLDFAETHEAWRRAVHALAAAVMQLVACSLGLPVGHFDVGAPFDIFTDAQLHLKCFKYPAVAVLPSPDDEGLHVTLLAHRDPSVLSIVVHNEYGCGLQVFDPQQKQYRNLRCFGPSCCTVFAGTVLEKITGSHIKSARHRVASTEEEMQKLRIAGTFFFQPSAECELRPLPRAVEGAGGDHASPASPPTAAITYGSWKAKAYGKYFSSGQQQRRQNMGH